MSPKAGKSVNVGLWPWSLFYGFLAPCGQSLWGGFSKGSTDQQFFPFSVSGDLAIANPCKFNLQCLLLLGDAEVFSDWSLQDNRSLMLIKEANIKLNFLVLCLESNPAFYYLSSLICESFVMHFPYKATSACCILYMSKKFRVFQYFESSGNPWGTVWHTPLQTYLLLISLLG